MVKEQSGNFLPFPLLNGITDCNGITSTTVMPDYARHCQSHSDEPSNVWIGYLKSFMDKTGGLMYQHQSRWCPAWDLSRFDAVRSLWRLQTRSKARVKYSRPPHVPGCLSQPGREAAEIHHLQHVPAAASAPGWRRGAVRLQRGPRHVLPCPSSARSPRVRAPHSLITNHRHVQFY